MVPAAFHDYFVASTGAGAALVGLLFVAVSIAPERTVMSSAPVERRAVALSAYTALLNAFFLSMVALLPQANLGSAALPLSAIGLVNQCFLAWDLLRHVERTWPRMVRGGVLIVAGLLLYGGELYNALLLLLSPGNSVPLSTLAALLLGIYALGLTRAWQLLGGRGHGLGEWLSPLHDTEGRQPVTNTDQSLSATNVNKDESR
jgi:hypothetical protein